ncbi:MAG: DUF397 domain-containing protein [Acidobacteriaceae bacterium]|nr:DUF397 domain-containing protein [Streptosporangiaceae bacterium]MBV9764091.1 DUF397 domain-containing protein [Acidobacteriaceae bacterium]
MINSPRWRKSSFSGSEANCVEAASADGVVLVRDTKDRHGQVHRFPADQWRAFVAGVRNGEFDLDGSGRLP